MTSNWIRELGATGLRVSAVCLGAGPLGGGSNKYGAPIDDDAAIELVKDTLASPIRFIDTSNGYSEGASENRIGAGVSAFGGLPDDVVIATKVDAKGADYSGERVRQSIRESQERLQMQHLPLVYLHDPEFHDFDDLTQRGGAVDALRELKDDGVIGHLGIAGGDVRVIERYVRLNVFEVLLTHSRWTLVDRSAGDLISESIDLGMGVVNAAIYGGGILAGGGAGDGATKYGYRPVTPVTLDALERIRALCESYDIPVATAALQASLRDSRISSTVIGFTKPERIAQIVSASQAEVPDEVWAELAELVPSPENWLDSEISA